MLLKFMALLLVMAFPLNSCAPYPPTDRIQPPEGIYLPQTLNDPIEPLNRGIWALNHAILQSVISPTARGYRMVVPSAARTSVKNFGYNLGYPGRALNQVLQGRMSDAGDESLRFVTNTTAGVVGLFDVASKWDIPKHRGNFGQTFQKWGWQGGHFIVLPFLGPSDECSAVGRGMDRFADPLCYHNDGRTMLYGVAYNNLSKEAENALRLLVSDPDSYDTTKAFWTYASKNNAPDWSLRGRRHAPSMETLAVATLSLRDPRFLEMMREATIKVSTTGKRLAFNYWIQKESAPLVYVVPGLGAHRQTMQALSVAEGLYDRGYSVVAISGNLHPEFIEKASSARVPGYATADRRDLWAVLDGIDAWIDHKHGAKLGARAMVGTSMGGFQALAMAAEADNRGGCKLKRQVRIERFLAVNPPVNLMHGVMVLDSYQEAPKAWPAHMRQQRVNNAVHKAVALITKPNSMQMEIPPFDATESKYLVGLAFRLTLRNAIYTSQRCHDLGNLDRPLSWWSREEAYNEILGMSYADYLNEIVFPHFRQEGISESQLRAESDLKHLAPGLANQACAHVIHSRNDFLLSATDLAWLRRTFGRRGLTLLNSGGHLGGLANPAVHDLIDSKLGPLKRSH